MNLWTTLPSLEMSLNGGDSGECRNSSSIRDPSQLGTLYTPNNENGEGDSFAIIVIRGVEYGPYGREEGV